MAGCFCLPSICLRLGQVLGIEMYLHIWDLGHVEEEVVGHTQRPPSEKEGEKEEATGTLRTDEA